MGRALNTPASHVTHSTLGTFPSCLGSWPEAYRFPLARLFWRRKEGLWWGVPTCPPEGCLRLINERLSLGPAASTLFLISLPPLGNGHHIPPTASSVLLFVTSRQ